MTMPAATPKDSRTPDSPAQAMRPPANGPMANPAVSTAPAVAAPAAPRRSDAHAVQELTARPTPTPTISRPANRTPVSWETSIAAVPASVAAAPASASGRRPIASETRPPTSSPGSKPTA